MLTRKVLLVLLSLVLVMGITVLPGCGGGAEPVAEEPAAPVEEAPAIDERAELIKVTDDYVSSEFSKSWLINPVDLNEKLFVEKEEGFQLVDLRSPEHFANGHIEGAVNVTPDEIVTEEGLAKLDADKTLILIDYDGSLSTAIHMYLTQLEYEVLTLRFGMSGWTTDPAISSPNGASAVWDGKGKDYPMVTTGFTAEPAFEIPAPSTGAKDLKEAVINGTKAFLASGGAKTITADELKAIVDGKDPKYQIVSLAQPDDYANGQIEGATSIPRAKIAKEESLKQLDPSKTIVVYCYQGHNSGMVQMFLKQLGYDVVSLQHGAGTWTNDRASFGTVKTYNPGGVKNFPVVK